MKMFEDNIFGNKIKDFDGDLTNPDNIEEYIKSNKDKSIYAENRNKKFLSLTKESQLRNYGYWNMETSLFYLSFNCFYMCLRFK